MDEDRYSRYKDFGVLFRELSLQNLDEETDLDAIWEMHGLKTLLVVQSTEGSCSEVGFHLGAKKEHREVECDKFGDFDSHTVD